MPRQHIQKPTGAFVAAAWAAMLVGAITYLSGLWNAQMQLNEKGYYFTLLMYGLFSAVSLQKSVRDRLEGIPVTGIYYGLCWLSLGLAVLLLTVGLWNATLANSEKGFYAMAFLLSLFGSVTVQKNIRDAAQFKTETPIDDEIPTVR
ncbi:MAG: YiaA/YiaB family protein [Hydrogenophaga sp.]|uniref:inner membrane protein YiaA n=1 Tax=Hydrogenophaga sp. TaxID=1904254 RepID=UPI0025BF71BE|nr:inner membrane protein YiaA [Hydrogenophaga sp.]MBU7572174.1 YiaA/YiaB family protein [Hydrogenophaga sp.]